MSERGTSRRLRQDFAGGRCVANVRRTMNPWLVLAACFLVSVGANAYFIAPASVVPLVVAEFGVTKAAAGSIISAAVLGSVLAQLPGGVLMDRYDNRYLMGPGIAVFLLSTIATYAVGGFDALLVLRLIGGVASGFVFTMGANVVGRVFSESTQGRATSVFITSAPVGFALAQVASPLVAGAVGLRAVMLAYAGISAVGYVLFLAVTPDPVRSEGEFAAADLRAALTNLPVLLVALSGFCAYSLYLFLNSWMPTYATEVLTLSLAGAGAVTALVPVVGVVARPTGGYLSDHIGYRRRPVIAGSLLTTLTLFLAIPIAGNVFAYAGLLLLAGFALQLSTGIYYVFTQELAVAGTEGTSLTVLTTVSFTGSLVSPVVGGWLVGVTSWTTTFAIYAVLGFIGAIIMVAVRGDG